MSSRDAVLVVASGGGADGPERCGGSGFTWRDEDDVIVTSAKWMTEHIRLTAVRGAESRSHYGSGHRPCPGSIPHDVEWRLRDPEIKFNVLRESDPVCIQHHLPSLTQRPLFGPNPPPKATTCLPIPPTRNQTEPKTDHSVGSDQYSTLTQPTKELVAMEAEVVRVCVMREVYSCLVEQLLPLNQWRCKLGGGEGVRSGGEGSDLVSVETVLLPLSCVVFLRVRGRRERSSFRR